MSRESISDSLSQMQVDALGPLLQIYSGVIIGDRFPESS